MVCALLPNRFVIVYQHVAQDLEKSKEKLQKELAVVKSEYSLLKDKSLQDITALKEELHVAKVLTVFFISTSRSLNISHYLSLSPSHARAHTHTLSLSILTRWLRANCAPSKATHPTSAAQLKAERRRLTVSRRPSRRWKRPRRRCRRTKLPLPETRSTWSCS